jgi:membrane dipeptidase
MKPGQTTGKVVAGACAVLVLVSSVAAQGQQSPEQSDSLLAVARTLSQRFLIIDTHIDAPSRLYRGGVDLSVRGDKGQFDFVRAREGGLDVPFMSIYIPSSLEGKPEAIDMADSLIDLVTGLASRYPDKFAVVTSTAQVRALQGSGRVLLAMGMENGAPINGSLGNIRRFHARGIRYITLAHAKNNHLSDASYDRERRWKGLSPFGREVVQEMNRVGIMIDVSHLSDSAFYQVLRYSRAPVIASHSSCRHFTPGFERNMSDEMIRLLAARGGVIQINFGSEFLSDEIRKESDRQSQDIDEHLRSHHLQPGDPKAREYAENYRKTHPRRLATVQTVADHIDHVVQLVGVKAVGIGSDFDGVGDTLPVGLKDVSCYPNLVAELLRRGYTPDDIRGVCGENVLRVWAAVEAFAAEGRQ